LWWIRIVGTDPNAPLLRPTIWSPASSLELNLLNTRWMKKYPGQPIYHHTGPLAPQNPVHSPLVLAVWQKQANWLAGSQYHALTWQNIHDLVFLLHDWSQVGGDSSLGRIKFGQTQPDLSNSGLMTLTLIAYSYFHEQAGLTPQDISNNAGFRTFLKDI